MSPSDPPVAAPTPQDVTKEEFIRQVKDEALRLQRAYKLSSAAALQEAFHRFEPFRVPERAAPTPETPSLIEAVEQFIAAAESYRCASAPVTDHFVTLEVAMIDARNKLRALLLAGAVAHPQPDPRTTNDDEGRCAICGWTLAPDLKSGCVRGNCSMRPFPDRFYAPERANREYGDDVTRLQKVAHPVVSPRTEEK